MKKSQNWLERNMRLGKIQQKILIHIFNEAGWEYQCLHTDLQWMMSDEDFQELKDELYPIFLEQENGKDLY
jgi:hypothetical protein